MAEIVDLSAAWAALQSGQPADAERIGREAVRADANNVQAWFLLGASCQRQGRPAEAAENYEHAIHLRPDHPEALNNLGNILISQGRFSEAEGHLRRALTLRPTVAETHFNLGAVLRGLARPAEAEASYQRALELRTDYAEALNGLASAIYDQGRPVEAVSYFRQAIQLKPLYAEAQYNLGNALRDAGQLDEAEASFRQAIQSRPDYAAAHNNLGTILLDRGRAAEAEACFRQVVRLQSNDSFALINLGNALQDSNQVGEAEQCFRHALWLRPDLPEAHNSLGNALRTSRRSDDAEACLRRAIALRPDYPEAHHNLGTLLLGMGQYEEGWTEYEWRWRAERLAPRFTDRPIWDGAPVTGALLLHTEQGGGDAIQFVRYAALAKARAESVILECPPRLIPLLSSCPGITQLVAHGSPPPPFDAHAPLLSLPRILGTTLETVPAAIPYLAADQALVERWRERLRPLAGFRVGVVWQGDPRHPEQQRFMPLAHFAPLAAVPGVRLISLQKGPGSEQLAAMPEVFDFGPDADGAAGAFTDTAAVMKNLDLVISADTAAVHVAGALGVPVWVALSATPDWRWLFDREDSPWYPTVRLYRQPTWGDWEPVFARMAADLRALSA